MPGYITYQFKDHDPVLDQLDRVRELAGNPKLETIAEKAGLSVSTLKNWHKREVKRPQYASVCAAVRAMGGHFVIVYKGKRVNAR